MKIPIHYHSPLFHHDGISKSSREYLKEFIKSRHLKIWISQPLNLTDIKEFGKDFIKGYNAFDLNRPHIKFLYGWTDQWFKYAKHPITIGYSVYEGDRPPTTWINNMNLSHIKEVWVPSEYVKDTYLANGCKKPIRVIPHGISPIYKSQKVDRKAVFKDIHNNDNLIDKFVFFGMGGIYGLSKRDRKGVDITIKAFNEEFGDNPNVALLLKLNINYAINSYNAKGERFDLDTYMGQFLKPDCNNVFTLVQNLTEEGLVNLFNAVDCGVFPSRGEGFGMPELEMMACGNPTITTDTGSVKEFSDKHLRIKTTGKKLAEFNHIDEQRPPYIGSKWEEPSVKDLRRLMRKVYHNYTEEKKYALQHSQKVKRKYDWIKIGKKNVKHIQEVFKKYNK